MILHRLRTNKSAKIVLLFTEYGGNFIAINRGKRENIKLGSVYEIREKEYLGPIRALLKVTKIEEKFSICKVLWVHERCPKVKRGFNIYLLIE